MNKFANCRLIAELIKHKRFSTLKHSFLENTAIKVSVKELQDRRNALCTSLIAKTKEEGKFDRILLLIYSSQPKFKTHHVPYKFIANSHFHYLTGITCPKSIYVCDVDLTKSNISHTLFIDQHDEFQQLWEGPSISLNDAQQVSGVDEVIPRNKLKDYFFDFSSKSFNSTLFWKGHLRNYFDPDPSFGVDHEADSWIEQSSNSANSKIKLADPHPLIDELRLKKSPYELECLKRAAEITSEYFTHIMRLPTETLLSESSIANEIEYRARASGCELAYPPVVAGGSRANIIHYLDANNFNQESDLILVDSGCKFNGYMADITRTWPISKKYSQPQRILQQILVQIQKECEQIVSPDVSLDDVYKFMLSRIIHHLVAEKIIPQPDSPLRTAFQICPHHVGHYLGLDIHDSPSVSYQRKMQAGFVFPLEPGIYFPLVDSKQRVNNVAKEFRGLALRLEDDYYMDERGNAVKLCDRLPSDAFEIEAFIQ
ncbi:Xaa-Pro aminopeptidase 3 [Cichlidogyrus casuarinus]|uniref:Xaa-Pro aminopeptidase 3 n=1 Tax=Cichlidogyrus casuarinus TaxID=1844966 RepID=A0ABD2Q3R8_9PLAT